MDTLCETIRKTGTETHPLEETLPKIPPQNTPLDAVLPTRKTRSSLIHQNTGSIHSIRKPTHPTEPNLPTGGRHEKTMGTTNLQPVKRPMKTTRPKTYGMQLNNSKREAYSNTILPQETRNISNKQRKLTSKAIRERTKKPKVSRRKEIIKIRSEINEK